MNRELRAAFDEGGVFVYQAFKPSIVEAALRRGTFAEGLEDVTPLARAVHTAIQQRWPLPEVPAEAIYPLDEELQDRLGVQ
jgi:hypothetical protein